MVSNMVQGASKMIKSNPVTKHSTAAAHTGQKRRVSEKAEDRRRVAANARIAARITDEQVRQALARSAKLRERVSPDDLNDE